MSHYHVIMFAGPSWLMTTHLVLLLVWNKYFSIITWEVPKNTLFSIIHTWNYWRSLPTYILHGYDHLESSKEGNSRGLHYRHLIQWFKIKQIFYSYLYFLVTHSWLSIFWKLGAYRNEVFREKILIYQVSDALLNYLFTIWW